MSNPVKDSPRLTCTFCTATAKNTSKERGRFNRRHPSVCTIYDTKRVAQAVFNQQLAEGVRSVEDGE
jgi:hypothetical protein